jgi:hypothetical protein
MEERYLMPTRGGRWAISRRIHGEWLALIESTPVDNPDHPAIVLAALGILPTAGNLERYFPDAEGLSPTLELLEMFAALGSKKPHECGV